MEPFSSLAGTAGAVLGGMQNLGAAIFGMLISSLPVNNIMPLAWTIIGCALLSIVFLLPIPDVLRKLTDKFSV